MTSGRGLRSKRDMRRIAIGASLSLVILTIAVLMVVQFSDRPGGGGRRAPVAPLAEVGSEDQVLPEKPEDDVAEAPAASEEPTPTVGVPRLIGLSAAEAKQLLEDANLSYREDERGKCPHHTIPSGYVTWQKPGPSEVAAAGATVTVTLSLGPPVAVPPGLVNRTYSEARAELERKGLRAKRVDQLREGVAPGRVLRVEPSSGTEVAAGSTVTLYVSAESLVTVPNVIGKSEAEARRALEAAGFTVQDWTNRPHDRKPEGAVLNTDPAPGARVTPGAQVTLMVSRGPEPIAERGRLVVRAASARAIQLHFCVYRPGDADYEPLWSRLTPGGEWHLQLPPGDYQVAAYSRDRTKPAEWGKRVQVTQGETAVVEFRERAEEPLSRESQSTGEE